MKNKLIITLLLFISSSIIRAQKSTDNPVVNFEKLWSEFNQNYANFELKTVDWRNTYNTYRSQINKNTTSDKLFDVSCTMLKELNDGHVTLTGRTNVKERYCGIENDVHIINEFMSFKNLQIIVDKELNNSGFSDLIQTKEKGLIHYSSAENYGYLRIDEMDGFSFGEINKSMKKALKAFEDKKGLIIDVRFNGGGSDLVSYKIAGRFVDKKRLGHYKRTRIKGTPNFTVLEPWYLKPKGKKQFTKPIIILTSDWSASATEIFVLALKELPYVTVVGNTTEGIFSDMYLFKLPNGWKGTLSHQQYFSAKMVNYEGKGIEPDFKVLNYKKDKADNVLIQAIELLDTKFK